MTGTFEKSLEMQARPAGLEPATPGLEGRTFHVEHCRGSRHYLALAKQSGQILPRNASTDAA